MEQNTPASNTELTLSAALLAPLNTIFEAQVHAARSFLSFIYQMGFRHDYTDEQEKKVIDRVDKHKKELEDLKRDKESIEKRKDELEDIERKRKTLLKKDAEELKSLNSKIDRLNQLEKEIPKSEGVLKSIENEKNDRKRIKELKDIKKNRELTNQEAGELKYLLHKWDEFHSLDFEYVDDQGNEHLISIPNLALIPVKPLAIDTANFKFEMSVNKAADFKTLRDSNEEEIERPWYLIQPKQLSGNIVSKGQSSQAAISIDISIKTTEMPAGLSKFLASVNESSRITLKKEI
jgi:hypothetical protein